MDLVDRFKQNLNTSPDAELPASGPLVLSEMTTTSTTWNTFLESMESARKKASDMFTKSSNGGEEISASKENVSSLPAPTESEKDSGLSITMKSWLTEASAFIEETRISVEEKITEMTGPVEMKNDPLKNLRLLLVSYTNALEQVKAEAFNFGLSAENMGRLGSQVLGRSLVEPFGESGTVTEQFAVYKDKHMKLIIPALDEVRGGVEVITQMVNDEIGRIQGLQTRFKRRDRLHQSLSDMKSRVNIKREKNNRRAAEGLQVDSKQMEELYELTRAMDAIDSDFRLTSEQLVGKCQEVLGNRSRTFHKILTKLVEVQNTYLYRLGSTCSIPFQELVEALHADVPSVDELEEVGSLTWRSDEKDANQQPEYMPMKMSPSRRATTTFTTDSLGDPVSEIPGLSGSAAAALKTASNAPPNRYSYSRGGGGSPIRRAGTSALLD